MASEVDAWPVAAEVVRSFQRVPDRSPARLPESLLVRRLWNETRTQGSHDLAGWLDLFCIIEFEVVAIPRPLFCAVAPAGKESGKLDE